MLADAALVGALILLNGVLALAEIAVVGSRRARLVQLSEEGRAGAACALELAGEPTRFLSTVQLGITCLGILSGAIGEAAFAGPLRGLLERVAVLRPAAGALSVVLVVLVLTSLSLVVGELVPKRLALTRPESFASSMARPMRLLSKVAHPVVYVLSLATDSIMKLMGVQAVPGPSVTPEEIKVLVDQGAEEGVIEPSEQELVTNVLNLDERTVAAILTPRSEIAFLDVRDPIETTRARVEDRAHSILPLCDGGLENVVGLVRTARVLSAICRGADVDLRAIAEPPLFVPQTMSLMRLLEHFKRSHQPVALVVDEFGDVVGLVSLMDVVSAIVGDLPGEPGEQSPVVQRADGSWLVEGTTDVETVERALGEDAAGLADEVTPPRYRTLAGLAMLTLARLPRTGDCFTRGPYRIEIVDMDGRRVDRVLITREPAATTRQGQA
jgi:putative hemolysin